MAMSAAIGAGTSDDCVRGADGRGSVSWPSPRITCQTKAEQSDALLTRVRSPLRGKTRPAPATSAVRQDLTDRAAPVPTNEARCRSFGPASRVLGAQPTGHAHHFAPVTVM